MRDVMSLCWASYQGDLNEIKRLVANGVDLDEADYDGRTCIHLAASEGRTEVIRYLLAKNITIDPKDRWGGTPLQDAKRHNHKDVVVLIENASEKKRR